MWDVHGLVHWWDMSTASCSAFFRRQLGGITNKCAHLQTSFDSVSLGPDAGRLTPDLVLWTMTPLWVMVRLGLERAELADYPENCGLGRGRLKQDGLPWVSSLESLSSCMAGSDGSKEPRTNQYVLGQLLWWLCCHSGSANNRSQSPVNQHCLPLARWARKAAVWRRTSLCWGSSDREPGPAG